MGKLITREEAEKVWATVRKIRLAKFNDNGVSLPKLDMEEVFHGRDAVDIDEVTAYCQRFIEQWRPRLRRPINK